MPKNAVDKITKKRLRALAGTGAQARDDEGSADLAAHDRTLDAANDLALEAANAGVLDAPHNGTEPVARPAVAEDGASFETDRVEMRLSSVGRVDASIVNVGIGAVGAARAETLSVDRGAVGAAMAGTVEVSRGYARSILARQVQMDRAAARVVIAADVHAKQSAVMFLVARRVSGEMRVLFDWRGALAFGAAAGLVIGLLSRLRRRG